MVRAVAWCIAFIVGLLTGCDRDIRATDYDQSCSVDTDCVAIEEGDVCFQCGAATAAVNIAEAEHVNADRNDRVGGCVLWDDVVVDCFCGNTAIVSCQQNACVLERSNCEPVQQPPTFLITSPPLDAPVPTNVDVRGHPLNGTIVEAQLLVGDDVVELALFADHCARINGCDQRFELGLLPARSTVELVVTTDGIEERTTITVGDGPDTTPPTVSALNVEATGVSAHRDEQGAWVYEMDVQFVRPAIDDDIGLAGAELQRRLDGGKPVLLEREDAFRDGPLVDSVLESEGAAQACYAFRVWDRAGNESTTPEVCVDVTIDDADKPTVCGAGGTGMMGVLALLLARRRRAVPTTY